MCAAPKASSINLSGELREAREGKTSLKKEFKLRCLEMMDAYNIYCQGRYVTTKRFFLESEFII